MILDASGDTANVRIHEDKNYTGVLGADVQQQIRDNAAILGRRRSQGLIPVDLTLPNGTQVRGINVTEVVVNFARPEALQKNHRFVREMVSLRVSFQVFDELGHPHLIRSRRDLMQFIAARAGESE